jgi:hypothetical protein
MTLVWSAGLIKMGSVNREIRGWFKWCQRGGMMLDLMMYLARTQVGSNLDIQLIPSTFPSLSIFPFCSKDCWLRRGYWRRFLVVANIEYRPHSRNLGAHPVPDFRRGGKSNRRGVTEVPDASRGSTISRNSTQISIQHLHWQISGIPLCIPSKNEWLILWRTSIRVIIWYVLDFLPGLNLHLQPTDPTEIITSVSSWKKDKDLIKEAYLLP